MNSQRLDCPVIELHGKGDCGEAAKKCQFSYFIVKSGEEDFTRIFIKTAILKNNDQLALTIQLAKSAYAAVGVQLVGAQYFPEGADIKMLDIKSN